jgi:hypothetical protein
MLHEKKMVDRFTLRARLPHQFPSRSIVVLRAVCQSNRALVSVACIRRIRSSNLHRARRRCERVVYFNFFLGRSWLVWPHFFLRCDDVSIVIQQTTPRPKKGDTHVTYAVDGPRWQTCVALAADHLVAVVLGRKSLERRLNDTATQTEHQVQC